MRRTPRPDAGPPGAAHARPPDDRRACGGWCGSSRSTTSWPGPAHMPWAPTVSWWVVGAGWLVLVSPLGRMALAAVGRSRCCCAASARAGTRGAASVHVRLWAAEQLAEAAGARHPRRRAVDQRTTPAPSGRRSARASTSTRSRRSPGCSRVGDGASIEPEVDLAGYWLDGDELHRRARPRRRRRDRRLAEHAAARAPTSGATPRCKPGSAVAGRVPARRAVVGLTGRRGRARRKAAVARRAPAASLAVGRRLRRSASVVDVAACRSSRRWPASLVSAWRCAAPTTLARAPPSGRSLVVPLATARRVRHPRPPRRSSPCGCSASGSARARSRCAAAWAGRCGPPSGSSTPPARCSSRSTPAWSPRYWLRALGADGRHGRRGVDRAAAARR